MIIITSTAVTTLHQHQSNTTKLKKVQLSISFVVIRYPDREARVQANTSPVRSRLRISSCPSGLSLLSLCGLASCHSRMNIGHHLIPDLPIFALKCFPADPYTINAHAGRRPRPPTPAPTAPTAPSDISTLPTSPPFPLYIPPTFFPAPPYPPEERYQPRLLLDAIYRSRAGTFVPM